MLLNIDNLISDLKALKEKYKITVKQHDNWAPHPDEGEMYVGTDHYFILNGEQYYVKTVEEIIEEIFK